MTFSVTLSYTGTASALGLNIDGVPAGWSFASVSGSNVPQVAPNSGDTGSFGFTYTSIPSSPASFSFTVNYPAGLSGNQTFSGISGIFRIGGVSSTPSASDISISPPPAPSVNSSGTVNAAVNHSFSYTISASGSPTSYGASGLPAGLSVNTSSGVISGTPSQTGSFSVSLSATNGSGTGNGSITINVGDVPSITSQLTAAGTIGEAFSYSITASNSASGYSADGLPAGLSVNASTGKISGTPTRGGTFNVNLSASNNYGSGDSSTLVVTIVGGTPPVITKQPSNQSATIGGSASFSVTATGALTYQWRKDGTAISGATGSALNLSNLTTGNAGNYSVVVSNLSASVTSDNAALTVNPPNSAPTVTTQPAGVTAGAGNPATFSVVAAGTAPLSYQWRKNGTSISGATEASYTVTHAWNDTAGNYSVTITNAYGATTSNEAPLTVRNVEYFGTFAGNGGTFAIYVRSDRTGVFLAYARASKVALVTKDLVFDLNGHFTVNTTTSAAAASWSGDAGYRTVARAATEYVVDGTIGADGTVSGSISGLGLTMSAPAPTLSGGTSSVAGFYQAGAAGSSATTYTIVSPAGDAYVATVSPTGTDAGKGTIDNSGNITVTTETSAQVTGKVDSTASISITTTPAGSSTPTTYSGGNPETRVVAERLINIATRGVVGTGANVMIAGFVVNGTAAKHVLIRGVGPTLADFKVPGTVANPQLKLYDRNNNVIAQNSGWTTSANAADIPAAGVQVGAFPLTAGSKDAALLMYVAPGQYTVQLSTTDDATGVGLVEVYEVNQ